MLPPPIPVLAGGRQLDAQQRLKRFVERERKLRKREAGGSDSTEKDKDEEVDFRILTTAVLQNIVGSELNHYSHDCLGRHLCHLGSTFDRHSPMNRLAWRIATFGLMWIQLEDRSQSFVQFLDNVSSDEFDEKLDCDLIFYKCSK